MILALFDRISFTLERIRQHLLLVVFVIVGITVAITLALSLPLYVDAVYSSILASRLTDPPYAFRYRYLGVWEGNIGLRDVELANDAITGRLVDRIDLPRFREVEFIRGGTWQARISETRQALGGRDPLSVGTIAGLDDQIEIIAGEWPPPANDETDVIPTLISESMVFENGIQLGDRIDVARQGGSAQVLEVAAVWRPVNQNDPSWIFPTKFFNGIFAIPRDDLFTILEGFDEPIDEVAWYLLFDGRTLRTSDIDGLLASMADGTRDIENTLPGTRLDLSPETGLRQFNTEVDTLTQQLFIIILPVGGLVLYFVSLVAGLLVTRQQPDDVKLRSRGMSRFGVLSIHILMWLMIVLISFGFSLLASPFVVRLIGQTASFLNFDGTSSVTDIVFTTEALTVGAVVGLISISSGLLLAWRIGRQNINSYRQDEGRMQRAWWQRIYLDLMLLIPAVYVLYTLQQQNGLQTDADTPFSDPLVFLGPTIFSFGLTLLFLRFLPWFLSAAARLVALTNNIPLLMALRELTRSTGRYRGALLMMAFTLSLTGFTASMASTLDRSLTDTIEYRIGGETVLITAADAQTEQSVDSASGQQTVTIVGYNAPPVRELEALPEIENLSRIGEYSGRIEIRNDRIEGKVVGIDRAGLAGVVSFREDFADQSLAEMLNMLASNRTGILLSRDVVEKYSLGLGETISFQINALGEWQNLQRGQVVGVLDYFPTLDPSDGFFLLTNIDTLFEMAGSTLPFNVWLSTKPGTDQAVLRDEIRAINFPVVRWIDTGDAFLAAQAEPARRGVLGFLSIGFVASIVLTLIGTIVQSTASFRAQSAQLGTLRAMGLGSTSVGLYMLLLQGTLTASGILSGTSIGIGTTLLFLPLLDFSGGLPPYLVRVAWGNSALVYIVFAAILFSVSVIMSLLLSRQQLLTVVKIGDA